MIKIECRGEVVCINRTENRPNVVQVHINFSPDGHGPSGTIVAFMPNEKDMRVGKAIKLILTDEGYTT